MNLKDTRQSSWARIMQETHKISRGQVCHWTLVGPEQAKKDQSLNYIRHWFCTVNVGRGKNDPSNEGHWYRCQSSKRILLIDLFLHCHQCALHLRARVADGRIFESPALVSAWQSPVEVWLYLLCDPGQGLCFTIFKRDVTSRDTSKYAPRQIGY